MADRFGAVGAADALERAARQATADTLAELAGELGAELGLALGDQHGVVVAALAQLEVDDAIEDERAVGLGARFSGLPYSLTRDCDCAPAIAGTRTSAAMRVMERIVNTKTPAEG